MASMLVSMALLCASLPAVAVTSDAATLIQLAGTGLCLDVHGVPVQLAACQPGSPDQMFLVVNSSIIQQSSGKCLYASSPTCPHSDWAGECCEHVDWAGGCTHWATTLSLTDSCNTEWHRFVAFTSSSGAVIQGRGDLSGSPSAPRAALIQYLSSQDDRAPYAGSPILLYSENHGQVWRLQSSSQAFRNTLNDEAAQRVAPAAGLMV